ncbi:MAG: hypothetical protein E7319_05340 [Clostridiales bacterium]|nr:hypothetical protein [Clostridiales bacterium]
MNHLEVLKRRLATTDDSQDALLTDLLTDAEQYVMAYTGRMQVPANLFGVVVELAAMHYARLGMQGESSHSEGGVTIGVDSLPGDLKAALDRYRLARVV